MGASVSLFDDQRYVAVFAAVATLRSFRGSVVDSVRDGSLPVAELLARSAQEIAIADMSVLPWFEAAPGVGKVASRRSLEALGVADAARTRDLTSVQAAEILATVEAAAA